MEKEKLLEQIEKNLPKEQAEVLKEKISRMSEEEIKQFFTEKCLFCEIAAERIETIKIAETKNFLAVLDIAPASLGHALIFPKQHFQFIFQFPSELLYELSDFLKQIIPVLVNVTEANGITIHAEQGLGQSIPHFCIFLVPRFKDDKIAFVMERKQAEKKQLEKIASEIKKRIEMQEKEKKEEEKFEKEREEREKKEREEMLKHLKRIP